MAKKIQLCHDLLLPPSAPKTSRVPEKARNVGAARLNPGIIFKKRKREKHHPSSSACRLLIYGFSLFICLSLPPMCAYTNGGGAYLVVRGTCDPADHEQEKKKVNTGGCASFSFKVSRGVAVFLLCSEIAPHQPLSSLSLGIFSSYPVTVSFSFCFFYLIIPAAKRSLSDSRAVKPPWLFPYGHWRWKVVEPLDPTQQLVKSPW